jgi:hypothetical protein
VETGQKFMTLQKTNNIPSNTNKRLSVQITLTGLSFLITHISSGEALYFSEKTFDTSRTPEEILPELESAFSTHNELSQSFDEVKLIYASHAYTLVPTALFDENKLSDYLKFNCRILANDFIAFDHVENNDIKVVYVPWVNINNYLFDRFGTFQYFNSISILLKLLLDVEKYSPTSTAYIHLLNDRFDLMILANGKLELCNTYSFRTPEDLIYYILFSFEQLKLNPDTVVTKVFGNIDRDDPNYEIIYKYVRNVSFFEKAYRFKDETEQQAAHRNVLLKSIA